MNDLKTCIEYREIRLTLLIILNKKLTHDIIEMIIKYLPTPNKEFNSEKNCSLFCQNE